MRLAGSKLARFAAATFGPGILAAVFGAASPAPAMAQGGAFVVRLGRDTIAVERFTRSATRLEGDVVYRQPRTTLRHYVVDLAADGHVTRAELAIRPGGSPESAPPQQRVVATFAHDSAVVEIRRDTAVITRRLAASAAVLPAFGNAAASWIAFELMVDRLRRSRADSVAVPVYNMMGANAVGSWSAKMLGRDSVFLFDGNDVFHVRVDRDGHILASTALSGTQQFSVERVATVDIAALSAAFAARDQGGQALGQLSPRDTVRATVGGANLLIDYSRPSKRGRVIFGSAMVPWGEVWRTGANAATQFRTDQALEMGGIVVPAGFYTLWTIPSPTGWKLLINSETGQWGTAHKAERDLYQLDLTVSALSQPVERFTITLVPGAQGGTLNLDWDTIRASIPFTVRQ
ncbi:MAG: DUF2911 domain-containing protein [Gemmatimonadales bacterium]